MSGAHPLSSTILAVCSDEGRHGSSNSKYNMVNCQLTRPRQFHEMLEGNRIGVYEVYQPTSVLSFVLIGDKIIVITRLQTFVVKYDHRNYIKQLNVLRQLIREGKITSVVDLVDYCNLRPGNHYQMQGLELVPTELGRHL